MSAALIALTSMLARALLHGKLSIVRGVPGTGAIADRAQALHDYLKGPEAGVRGKPLNFVGHSMGGLDARYLISILQPAPEEYIPLSLTTLNAPHRGSPFMDWCMVNWDHSISAFLLTISSFRSTLDLARRITRM